MLIGVSKIFVNELFLETFYEAEKVIDFFNSFYFILFYFILFMKVVSKLS